MDTVRFELGAPFPLEEGCRKSSAVDHAPHPPPVFGGSVISIPTRMGKLCHQINAASPSRFFDLPLPLERDLAKKKKAVGCLSSKKYSNHNYTHTLESSCLCQVAEINVALPSLPANVPRERARVQKSSSPGPTTNLVCMKTWNILGFLCWIYLEICFCKTTWSTTYVHLDCNTSFLVVKLGSLNGLTGIVKPTLSKEECSLFYMKTIRYYSIIYYTRRCN